MEKATKKPTKKNILSDALKALRKEVKEVVSTTEVLPTKTISGTTGQTPMKSTSLEPSPFQKKITKVVLPPEEEEEEIEEPLKRKDRQQVETLMSFVIIASARLIAFSLVENVKEDTQKEDEVLREQLGSSFASVVDAVEVV